MNTKIKLEKSVVDDILSIIENTKKGKTATINGKKNINAIKKIAEILNIPVSENYRDINTTSSSLIVLYNPIGEWNGYGYNKYPQEIIFPKIKIKKFLLKNIENKKTKVPLTEEQKIQKWINRLVKLTGISQEKAFIIAKSKFEYKQEKINDMYNRQADKFSEKREKLISKMERENPLRTIENTEHAERILEAHRRHINTDYDNQLDEGRYQAEIGNIDKNEIREYARCNMNNN